MKQYEKEYIKQAEEEHRLNNAKKICLAQDRTSTIWKIINQETGYKKVHPQEAPSSEEFSEFFNRQATKPNSEQPAPSLNQNHGKTFFMVPTDRHEVQSILGSMKAKKSEDIYGLSANTLKWVSVDVAEPLSAIINTSMATGSFPRGLKAARITPVYKKKGDKTKCESYRPIAILPAVSKVFEEVILRRLYNYFEKNQLFAPTQFAYRQGKSTTDAARLLIQSVHEAVENRLRCKAQMCDLSRAFDTVPHLPLLQKLEGYGVRGIPLQLIQSYLMERRQQVTINGTPSAFTDVTIGLPQGSLMGGLMFIIYMNDLPSCTDTTTIIYADDTTLLSTARTDEDLQRTSSNSMQQAKLWFTNNNLHLNETKTEQINFQMDRWEQVDNAVRFLGIYIDPRLTWKSHIEYLAKTLSRAIFAIRRIQKTAGNHAAQLAYRSLFEARAAYAIEIWGHSSHIGSIFTLQKRAVRSLTSEHPHTHCRPLFQKHRILTIHALYLVNTLTNIHRTKANIPTQSDIHGHQTRNRNDLRPNFARLATTAQSSKIIKIYNHLQNEWKSLTPRAFRNTIKGHLLEVAPYSIEEFAAKPNTMG